MKELPFKEIAEKIDKLDLPETDMVVGIAEGGIVPAALIALKLKCDIRIIKASYRGSDNVPIFEGPVITGELDIPENISNILLVDDVSVSGKTIGAIKERLGGYSVKTLVFKGNADIVFFPEIEECVVWPWMVKAV